MAKSPTRSDLAKLMGELLAERKEHVDAIASIDGTLGQLGVSPRAAARGAGRREAAAPKKATKRGRKRGKRGSYKKTADEFILSLLTRGRKLTTAQIGAKWRQAKRGGKPDNALTKLVKEKKVNRQNIKGSRGSVHRQA